MQSPTEDNMLKTRKQQLRELACQCRVEQPNKASVSKEICNKLAALTEYEQANPICSYVGVGDEVVTLDLLHRALEQGKRVAVPYVDKGQLILFHLESIAELGPAPFGLLEPLAKLRELTEKRIDPVEIECFLVPGLAFGVSGERLGHGKGYYDNLLNRSSDRAYKIGVCFACQLMENIPMMANDVPMDMVTTELGIAAD